MRWITIQSKWSMKERSNERVELDISSYRELLRVTRNTRRTVLGQVTRTTIHATVLIYYNTFIVWMQIYLQMRFIPGEFV